MRRGRRGSRSISDEQALSLARLLVSRDEDQRAQGAEMFKMFASNPTESAGLLARIAEAAARNPDSGIQSRRLQNLTHSLSLNGVTGFNIRALSKPQLVALFRVLDNLSGSDLSGMDLRSISGRSMNLSHCNLSRCNLDACDLQNVSLVGSDLRGAKMRGADLRGAHISGANLSRANLSGADLAGARASDVDFRGARLTGANLYRIVGSTSAYPIRRALSDLAAIFKSGKTGDQSASVDTDAYVNYTSPGGYSSRSKRYSKKMISWGTAEAWAKEYGDRGFKRISVDSTPSRSATVDEDVVSILPDGGVSTDVQFCVPARSGIPSFNPKDSKNRYPVSVLDSQDIPSVLASISFRCDSASGDFKSTTAMHKKAIAEASRALRSPFGHDYAVVALLRAYLDGSGR